MVPTLKILLPTLPLDRLMKELPNDNLVDRFMINDYLIVEFQRQ